MKNIIVDDAMLDRLADEYFNDFTVGGSPLHQIYTFEQYVEMKKGA